MGQSENTAHISPKSVIIMPIPCGQQTTTWVLLLLIPTCSSTASLRLTVRSWARSSEDYLTYYMHNIVIVGVKRQPKTSQQQLGFCSLCWHQISLNWERYSMMSDISARPLSGIRAARPQRLWDGYREND